MVLFATCVGVALVIVQGAPQEDDAAQVSAESRWPWSRRRYSTTPAPAPYRPAWDPTTPALPLPWDPAAAVAQLNAMYMDFDETNDDSRMGVTISFAGQPSSLDANLFCSDLMNTGCNNGQADCRTSATVFNHKVVVDGDFFVPTMRRQVGYVFNQEMSETYFGKCSYLWDGATFNSLNGGCGATSRGGNSCDNPSSAYYGQCSTDPTTPHACTRTDLEVESKLCKCEPPLCSETYGSVVPPPTRASATCFYEMPALVYGNSTATNHLRDGLKQRVALQGADSSKTQEWNELVIDNRLLIPKLREEPTNTILAFVCVPSLGAGACQLATRMRDQFHLAYGVEGPGIPVVAIDTTVSVTANGGPFVVVPTEFGAVV